MRYPVILVVLSTLLAASAGGCVYDRTGRSASGRMLADVQDARTRLVTAEERLAREGARVDELDQRTQNVGRLIANSGADLQAYFQSVQGIQGELSSLRQDLGKQGQSVADLDARIVEIDERLAAIEDRAAPPADKDGGRQRIKDKAPAPSGPAEGKPASGGATGGGGKAAEPQPAPASGVSVSPPATPAGEGPTSLQIGADDLFVRALAQVRDQKWGAASASLQSFLERFPAHAQVGQARFLLAECLFNLGEYRLAVQRYQEYIDAQPGAPDKPKAMLRQGQAFIQMGGRDNLDAARLFLSDLVEGFPGSPEAARAREELARLK